ncbi:ATP-binding protein [candidate division KSB1 bacterium]|nr:ATP-binding protein [candidate division KSB1 bacterium]
MIDQMTGEESLKIICAEGEGQKIEFKAKLAGLAKEMVAFANASGGLRRCTEIVNNDNAATIFT